MGLKNFVKLREVLRGLPFNEEKKLIGVYGLGNHTKRLLQAYRTEIGPIRANLIFIDSKKETLSERIEGYDVYNVRDIGELPLESVILSSLLYEEEMNQTLRGLYGKKFTIYRFYEWGKDEIFDVGGMYLKTDIESRKILNVNFVDFWPRFAPQHNLFEAALFMDYKFVISDTPDVLFCSHFGQEHKKYNNCIKVFLETEVMPFSFQDYDYVIGFRYIKNQNYFRYSIYEPRVISEFQNRSRFQNPLLAKRKFCNFIYSNDSWGEGALLRKEFCMALSQYKHIDCPGKVLNNMENAIVPRKTFGEELSKREFIKQYKFTIAFENHRTEGYTTEKLWDAFREGSIPIYWGNPLIDRNISPEAFINCNDYHNDWNAVIEKIKEIDSDDAHYMDMLQKSPLKDTYCSDFDGLQDFLKKAVESI